MHTNNIIITISFVAFLVKFLLSIFIYKKNKSAVVNRIFALLFFSQAIWDLGKSLMWLTGNYDLALLFGKLSYTGYMISVFIFPHFCWVFLKKQNIFRKSKTMITVWYIPLIILIIMLWSNGFVIGGLIPGAESSYGYGIQLWEYDYGPAYNYFFLWFQILPFIYGFGIFIYHYFKTRLTELKERLRYLVMGTSFPILIGIPTGIILPALGFRLPPHNNILTTLMSIFIGIGIIKYKFFDIKPNHESVNKKVIHKDIEKFYRTRLGEIYFVIGKNSLERAYHVFLDALLKKHYGLVITSKNPVEVRGKYSLNNTPIVCMTDQETEHAAIGKHDLEQLYRTIVEFAKKVNDSYILLDGIEYLIKHNNLQKVAHLLSKIKKEMAEHNCCLIIPEHKLILNKKEKLHLKKSARIIPKCIAHESIEAQLLRDMYKHKKAKKDFIILGYNETSEAIISEFEARNIKCTLVNNDDIDMFYPKGLVKFVKGDPLSRRVLSHLKIDDIHKTILLVMDDDADVILATNIIRQLTDKATIIANIHDLNFLRIAEDSGANYVIPSSTIGGKLLGLGVSAPAIVKWIMDSITYRENKHQLVELDVERKSSLIGKSISKIDHSLQEVAHILAVRTGEVFNELPDDEYIIEEEDVLVLLTAMEKEHLKKHMGKHVKK
jgi:Trk K+ transport system NAD-binding subunit